jgi:ubiquinone/menaquinone biosynthesis C-methylase UbiE
MMAGVSHRFFAAIYDRLLKGTEDAGLRDMRGELLARARGRTLELGAGTGLNLEHYPEAVEHLVMTEPDPHMARRLRARIATSGAPAGGAEVVQCGAEELPFEDRSFDSVVSTLVLCTVEQPERALDETARVLRPGGRFFFLEHVRSDDGRLARWQDRLERPWGFFSAGCHPNRPTPATLASAGLDIESMESGELPKAPPIVRPLISGVAVRPAD